LEFPDGNFEECEVKMSEEWWREDARRKRLEESKGVGWRRVTKDLMYGLRVLN
jgi:hypothetical protein